MKAKLATALSVLSLTLAARAGQEFVAHEWGTFTSVQGSDGVQLEWSPLIRTDLPKFVYSRASGLVTGRNGFDTSAFTKASVTYTRMETPVIYFYSDRERTADVTVQMPAGRITEWYPRATRIGPYFTTNKSELGEAGRSFIEWKGITILPPGTKEISAGQLIRAREDSRNHYYQARETDANFVRVPSRFEPSGAEYERDLFYRGVGFFQGPLTLKLSSDANELSLTTKASEPLTDLFVLTIQKGQARYQRVASVEAKGAGSVKLDAKPFAPLSDVRAQIMREMCTALAGQGLYTREAEAMVKTWEDQWFAEEGTRVLYLLPREWTDKILPLSIEPQPESIVRVMVGRAELITPAMEQALKQQLAIYHSGNGAAKQRAVAAVRELGLGRFLEPATRKMLGQSKEKELIDAAWKLVADASKPVTGKTPAVADQPARPARPTTAAVTGKAAALAGKGF